MENIMYKFLFFLGISFLMISCTPKNTAFRYFDKGVLETKGVKATKKTDIVKDKEVDVIFISTYLNEVDEKLVDKRFDSFLVFTYFANETQQDFEENGYLILLNENEPSMIKKIEKDDEKYSALMLKNHWGTYYLVEFESLKDSKNLNLVLQNKESNKATLNFAK